MSRWIRPLVLVGVLTLVAGACASGSTVTVTGPGADGGGSSDPDDPRMTEVGEGEGALNIVAWAGYIERGETDPEVDWVTEFEADTGCKVNVTTANTSDEMVSLMQGGGEYDLVTASGDASLRLVEGGTVQPVNIDLIPSYDTIDPRLQEAAWHTVDTDQDGTMEHYGTPYTSGSNVLLYSTAAFKNDPPDSWDVVFEEQTLPDGESNKGRVQAYDGAIYIADAALYLKATQPELGIEDPYALNQEQFDAATDLLRQQRELIHRYWHDAYVQMDDFASGEAVVSGSWGFMANNVKGAGTDFKSVVPKEGAAGWADTTMLHTDAPHPNCAYKWMEWSLNTKLQGDLAWWFGTIPAVLAACEGNEFLGPDGCSTNGLDTFDEIMWWKTPQADCFEPGSGKVCVPYYVWVTTYVAIIGGR
jgi:putative spermidine/putrescine transport system substrate-binding protein